MPTQSLKGANRGRVCVCAFISMSVYARMYERLHLSTVFKRYSYFSGVYNLAILQCNTGPLDWNDGPLGSNEDSYP